MRAIAVLSFVAAAGCATTPGSIRQLPPKAVLQTSKSAAAVEECLAHSKLSLLGGPSIVHGPSVTSLAFGDGGITSLLIEIELPTVTVRSGYGFPGTERRWIEDCLR